VAAQAQRRVAHDERASERAGKAERTCRYRFPSVVGGEHGGGVAADRREGVMAERNLSSIAHENVESGDEDHVNRRKLKNGDEITACDEHIDDERRSQHPQHQQRGIALSFMPDRSARVHRGT
jgi:hypothetical protein